MFIFKLWLIFTMVYIYIFIGFSHELVTVFDQGGISTWRESEVEVCLYGGTGLSPSPHPRPPPPPATRESS